MKIVVIGQRNGLAQALVELGRTRPGMTVRLVGRPHIDISQIITAVHPPLMRLRELAPDVIINTARVWGHGPDQGTEPGDEERMFAVNGDGATRVARIAEDLRASLIHVSEADVFDGRSFRPYRETDPVNPVGSFGLSLVAGEAGVRGSCRKHLILRAGWRIDALPDGAVARWVASAESNLVVLARNDVRVSPTSVFDLADAILRICNMWRANPEHGLGETLHCAGPSTATPLDVARQVLLSAAERELIQNRRGLESPTLSGTAPLSINRTLDSSRLAALFEITPQPWTQGLGVLLERLAAEHTPRSAA